MIKEPKSFENISGGKEGTYLLSPPSRLVTFIEPEVYRIHIPDFGVPYFSPAFSNNLKRLKEESASWDFEGCTEHSLCISDMKKFYESGDFYKKVGVRFRRGIILYGPPGTGKSVIAKSMALQAAEMGIPVFVVSGREQLEIIPRIAARCLVWIDEMDDLGDLTTAIDNLNDGTFVVGTTNYPENMKERIFKRPGRFDRVLEIKKMTPGMIRNACKKYFIDTAFEDIMNTFDTITPAQLAEVSLRHNIYGVSIDAAVRSVKEEFH